MKGILIVINTVWFVVCLCQYMIIQDHKQINKTDEKFIQHLIDKKN